MPNDVPDWTAQTKANLVGGISGLNLGDVGAPSLSPDAATETITTSGGPLLSASMVLASFKAAAGLVIAPVGSLGALTTGSNTSVSPAFGQATTAGNLLVAWVTSSSAEPTTGQAGWVKVKSFTQDSPWAAIWAKPNAAGGDAAPTFTAAGGSTPMHAQLGEFSGAATVTPSDQTASAGSNGAASLNPINAAADVAFGDLVLVASRWALTSSTTATFSESFNNGAAVVHAGDSGGTAQLRQSSFAYGIVPAATVAQPLGVAPWDWDAAGTSAPVAGSQASVVLAATPGKTYHCHTLSASILETTGAADRVVAQLLDGAAVVWSRYLAIAGVPGSAAGFDLSEMARKGTLGSSMTFRCSAPAAGTEEAANIGAYLR